MADKSGRKSSILKTPKKPRTPLQDVNTLNVNPCDDEDEECEGEMTSTTSHTAALRRRVSFAGTNLVKEFYSESECASVWHGPTYEEPLTMCSDSSGAPSDSSGRTSILFQQSQHTLQTSTISTQAASINIAKVSVREEDPCEAIMRQFGCQTGLIASKEPHRKARFSFGDPEPSNTVLGKTSASQECSTIENRQGQIYLREDGGDVLMEMPSQEQFRPSETENSRISHHHEIPSMAQPVRGSSGPVTQITFKSCKTVCRQSSHVTGSVNQISCDNFEMISTSALSYVTDCGTLNESSESVRGKATNRKDIDKENSLHESVKITQCNQNIPNNSQPEASSIVSREVNVLQSQCNNTSTSSQNWMTQHQSGSLDQIKYDINTSRPVPSSVPEISSVNVHGVNKESLTLAKHSISDSVLAPVISSVSTKMSLNQSNYNDVEMDFTSGVSCSTLAPVLSTLKSPEVSNELSAQTKCGSAGMEHTKQSSRLSLAPVVSAVKLKENSTNVLSQTNYDHEDMDFTSPVPSSTLAPVLSTLKAPEVSNELSVQTICGNAGMEHTKQSSRLSQAPVVSAVKLKENSMNILSQTNYDHEEMDFTSPVPSSTLAPVLSTLKAPEVSKELPVQTKCGNVGMELTKKSSRLSLAPVVSAVKSKENSTNVLSHTNYDHEEMDFTSPVPSSTLAPVLSTLKAPEVSKELSVQTKCGNAGMEHTKQSSRLSLAPVVSAGKSKENSMNVLSQTNYDPEEMNSTMPIDSSTLHTASAPNHPEGINKTLDQRKDDALKRGSLSRPASLLKTSDDSRMFLHETRLDGVEMDFTKPLPSYISVPTFSHAENLQVTTEVAKYHSESATVALGCDPGRAECSNIQEDDAETDARSVLMELTEAANGNGGSESERIFNPVSSANAVETHFLDESMEFTKCVPGRIDCLQPNISPKVSSHAFQIETEPLSNTSESKISSSKHSEIILGIQPTTFPGNKKEHENMLALATEGVTMSGINVSDLNVPISSQTAGDAIFLRNENHSCTLLKNASQSSVSKLQNTCFLEGSIEGIVTNSEKTQVFDESMEFTEVLPGNIQEEFLNNSDDSVFLSGNGKAHEHAFASSSIGTAANCMKMIGNKCEELSCGIEVHTEACVTHSETVACSPKSEMQRDCSIVSCSNVSVQVQEPQILEPSSSEDHPLNPNSGSHTALPFNTDLPDHKGVQEVYFVSNGNNENSKDCSSRRTFTICSGVKRDSTGRATSPYNLTQSPDQDCEGTSELLEAGCNPSKRLCTSGLVNCPKDYEKDAVENAILVVPSSRSPSPERSLYDTIPALSPELWKVRSQPAKSIKADSKNTESKSYCEENDNFVEHLHQHSSSATSSSNGDQRQVLLSADHTSSDEVSQLLASADSDLSDSGVENSTQPHGDTAHLPCVTTPSITEECKIHSPRSTAVCNQRAEGCEKDESFSSNRNISMLADVNKIEEYQVTEATQKDTTQVAEHEVVNICNLNQNTSEIDILHRMSPGFCLEDKVDIMDQSFPSLEATGIDLLNKSIAVASKNVEKMFQQSLVHAKQYLNASSQNLHSDVSSGGLPTHTSSNDLSRQNCATFQGDGSILDVKDCPQSTTAALKFDITHKKSPERSCLGASPRALVVPNNSSQYSFRISPQKTITPIYISEQKPRPVEEFIHEYETKDDCLWIAHKESDSMWVFSFKCLHLDLKVHLESPTEPSDVISGKNAAFVCKLTESNKPLLHWGRRILMSKLSTKEFRTDLCYTLDFMGLLQKISTVVAENRKFLLDLMRLEGTKCFQISGDSLTFDVISFACKLWFVVKMKLDCWENYTPAHISIENRLGCARESEVQELVHGVTKDVKFFTNYYNDIMEYVATLEALHNENRPTT